MTNDFKKGFSKGIGLTTGVLAIPVAGLLLFGAYQVLKFPVMNLLESEEMDKYYDCVEKMFIRFDERSDAFDKSIKGEEVEIPPKIICEKPTRKWKWQPKEENK